jgi:hypothetical protein
LQLLLWSRYRGQLFFTRELANLKEVNRILNDDNKVLSERDIVSTERIKILSFLTDDHKISSETNIVLTEQIKLLTENQMKLELELKAYGNEVRASEEAKKLLRRMVDSKEHPGKDGRFVCGFRGCKTTFSTRTNLNVHLKKQHLDIYEPVEKRTCSKRCGYTFYSPYCN